MKKVLWMLVLAAFVGCGVAQSVAAADNTNTSSSAMSKGESKTISGTIKVDGSVIKLVADDGEYILKGKTGDYKSKDGQKVEITGVVKENKKGVKTLVVGGGHHKTTAAQ
jgi:hypothetical protein